ncbi:protein of unknown function [Magnetospirillum sp. XM-1]|uniref:DegT/DnrJ/EryC1/StrS family aminotransferase n=1 Tax=Magnetospirillum sp. XM-1 TaxID=1663591 RepID=UPI00073DDD04|nr:DegT/DnrJ/EryC1/StrS family aminotransferase [Magnetospirillum sp. XM-1]CUW37973.1 protein of unknown function [Magnetospirillum sp. XM-1]
MIVRIDLRVTDDHGHHELPAAVDAVLRHGRLALGPGAARFESLLAECIGRTLAVSIKSGTDALVPVLAVIGEDLHAAHRQS